MPNDALVTKVPLCKDYIFSLLTGYVDPPAGVKVLDGLNYNPYFPGGAIAMARVLFDGVVEYPDGMCAPSSAMLKLIVQRLRYPCDNQSNGQGCGDLPLLGGRT